jgi:hypothetical protein
MVTLLIIFSVGALLGGLLGYGYAVEENHRHYLKGYGDGYRDGREYRRPWRILRSVKSA